MLSLTRLLTTPLLAGLLLLGHPGAQAETASLQLDNNGNITQRSTSRGTTTYTYDALNRLDTESGPAKTQTFKYDADGNRLSDGSGSYTYSPTANRMATRLGATVTLDPAGHITADGTGRTYTYNQAGQLTTSSKGSLLASYYYNAQGQRTRKVTTANAPQGAQTTVYHYDLQGHLIAETSGTGTPIRTYVWRDDTPIAQIEHQPSRKIFYYEVDHLNTPRAAMDEAGKVVWRWESDAFGTTAASEDPDGDGIKVAVNLRFPGQYYDQETGLHYNYFRNYDPGTGRYTTSDPIGLAGGVNTYTYVGGNPLSDIDPFGLDWKSTLSDAAESYLQWRQNNFNTLERAMNGDQAANIDVAMGLVGSVGRLGSVEQCVAKGASKIDRGAFKAEREAFWKAEAKNNTQKYNAEDLVRMNNGRAPTGPDGHPMELHHVDRTPEGGIQPMSRTDHRLGDNYKKNHP